MKSLLKYMRGYSKECVLGPLFKLFEATLELFVPLIVASIIDNGILASDKGHIIKMVVLLVAIGLAGLLAAVTAQFFAAKAAVGKERQLQGLCPHVGSIDLTPKNGAGLFDEFANQAAYVSKF